MTRSTAGITAPRLFVTAALHTGAEVAASPGQAHYLATVLRRVPGEAVRLFNGRDGEWAARIAITRRDRLSLTVDEHLRPQAAETGPWLVFALLKRDATDLVVRQAVELGASRVLPVVTERTNASRVNDERLRAIAIEAAEQSERLTIPDIAAPARLDAVLAGWPEDRRLHVALERSASPTPAPWRGPAALLVGPEGGFTASEREMLRRLPFVVPVSLGRFVLRAETAAAAGQALLLGMGWAEYGGFQREPIRPQT